jgi:hypothetical protein
MKKDKRYEKVIKLAKKQALRRVKKELKRYK